MNTAVRIHCWAMIHHAAILVSSTDYFRQGNIQSNHTHTSIFSNGVVSMCLCVFSKSREPWFVRGDNIQVFTSLLISKRRKREKCRTSYAISGDSKLLFWVVSALRSHLGFRSAGVRIHFLIVSIEWFQTSFLSDSKHEYKKMPWTELRKMDPVRSNCCSKFSKF